MVGRRALAWSALVVSLATWALVAWQHFWVLRLGWYRAGLVLVLLGPLLVVYGITLLRHVATPPPPDGVGEYGAAPPPQWAVFAMLAPLLVDWFENPLTGRGWVITFLTGTRTATLAALAALLLYLIALLRVRYRLTESNLDIVVDGRIVLSIAREAIIYVPGIAGNAEETAAERFGVISGAVPVESPGSPFGHGMRIYYVRNGRPHAVVLLMTPELRQGLALWLTSKPEPHQGPR